MVAIGRSPSRATSCCCSSERRIGIRQFYHALAGAANPMSPGINHGIPPLERVTAIRNLSLNPQREPARRSLVRSGLMARCAATLAAIAGALQSAVAGPRGGLDHGRIAPQADLVLFAFQLGPGEFDALEFERVGDPLMMDSQCVYRSGR